MSEELKGTNIYAPIVPGTDEDNYPTHYSKYGKGGLKCVRSIEERDAIPMERLEVPTLCYVMDDDLFYVWNGSRWNVKEMGSADTGLQRNVRLVNDLDSKNVSASKGEPCFLKFTFVSQERYSSKEPYENTGEQGLCQIAVRNSAHADYRVVKQMNVNSATPLSVDVSEFLTSGVNNVMLKVTGEVTEVATPALVYTVQLTALSIHADNFKWWTAYNGDILFNLNIGGNVSKSLFIAVDGADYHASYEVPVGTGVYIETSYNYSIPHPGKTGVFHISAYVTNADGSIKTRTVSFNVICAMPGEYAKLIAINNVLGKAVNWAENTLFEYAMYDGDNVSTSAQFVVRKDKEDVFTSDEDSITCSAKHVFSLALEVETMDHSEFEIAAHVRDEERELAEPLIYKVDNSSGYSAVPGAVFYLNPKTRGNSQANRQKIVNEIDGSEVEAVWKGVNWGNDCWTTSADGEKVLRLTAGSLLTIDRQPFRNECARRGMTLEIDYKIDNVTDYSRPVITVSSPAGDSFIGLNIYADDIIMHTQSLKNDSVQSLHTFEGKRIRLTMTVLPAAYGNPGFNLCILYINGRKNREFTYEDNDYFAQPGSIVIGSDFADVDIYGIREYESGLTSQGVLTNYINWLSGTEEKARVKAFNDILDSNGSEIDFDNTKDQFNCLVFDNTIPFMLDQTQRKGTLEVLFHDHPEWNVSISNVTAKGQGTSSMKYYLWNTRYQLDKAASVITFADGTSGFKKWQMVPWIPAAQKFTAKKNYASSMQSHKIGAVNSYEDLYREMGLLNEAMRTDAYRDARVAVYQLPFMCFEKLINDEGKTVYTFKGLYTFGPDKGDKYTFGYDTDLFPEMISIEGSDNSPLCTLFRVPWNLLSNAFNADARIAYENGKLAYIAGTYSNDTDPITQSLGDHYTAEQRWITKRILYMMSKYSFGLFSANGSDTITVRAAGNTIRYELTPAMDMYPAIANGTSIIRGARTKAGEVCVMEIELSGSGDQQNAIQGASYLQDIGDWHDKNVQGSMIIQGRMLRDIRLGSKTGRVIISITSLTLSNCTSLQRLLLSNISALSGTLNLAGCTHLQEVHADGTSLVQIILPKGGGLRTVEFSAYNQYLSLANYPLMTNEGVGIDLCKGIITDFFITGCPLLRPMQLLIRIMDAQAAQGKEHKLKRIRAVGFEETYHDSSVLERLTALSDGTYQGLSAEGLSGEDEYPVLDGILNVRANVYEDSLETLRNAFSKLVLNVTGERYIRFKDAVAGKYMIEHFGDGTGITKGQMGRITAPQLGNPFTNNNQITSFDEMKYLENFNYLDSYFFLNCTSLVSVVLPPTVTHLHNSCFRNTALKTIFIPKTVVYLEQGIFEDCKYLESCIFEEGRTEGLLIRWSVWSKTALKEVSLPDNLSAGSNMEYCFAYCKELVKVRLPDNLQAIPASMFLDCSKLTDVNIPASVSVLGAKAFCGCSSLAKLDYLGHITSIEQYTFSACSALSWLRIPATCTFIAKYSFEHCNVLTTLIVEAATPPEIEMYTLNEVAGLKIYVPDASVNLYKTANIWAQYAGKIYPLSLLPAQ